MVEIEPEQALKPDKNTPEQSDAADFDAKAELKLKLDSLVPPDTETLVLDACNHKTVSVQDKGEGTEPAMLSHGLTVLARTDAGKLGTCLNTEVDGNIEPELIAKFLEHYAENPGSLQRINISVATYHKAELFQSSKNDFIGLNRQIRQIQQMVSEEGKFTELGAEVKVLSSIKITPENLREYSGQIRKVLFGSQEASPFSRIDAAVESLHQSGVSVFFATNNSGPDAINYLALNDKAHLIGATDPSGKIANYSANNSLVDAWHPGNLDSQIISQIIKHGKMVYQIDLGSDGLTDATLMLPAENRLTKEEIDRNVFGSSFAAPKAVAETIAATTPKEVDQILRARIKPEAARATINQDYREDQSYKTYSAAQASRNIPTLTRGGPKHSNFAIVDYVAAEILYKHVPEELRNHFALDNFSPSLYLRTGSLPNAPLNDIGISIKPLTYKKIANPKLEIGEAESYKFSLTDDGKTIEILVFSSEYGFRVGDEIARKYRATEDELGPLLTRIVRRIEQEEIPKNYFNLAYDKEERVYRPRHQK